MFAVSPVPTSPTGPTGSAVSDPVSVLRPEQRRVHDFLVHTPYAAVWLPMGAGKTVTVLAALRTIAPTEHILVSAPAAVARATWPAEIARWGFPLPVVSLLDDPVTGRAIGRTRRVELVEAVADHPPALWLVNHDVLTRPARRDCPRCHGDPGRTTDVGVCRDCQSGVADILACRATAGRPWWPFSTVVLDEAQAFKNHRARKVAVLRRARAHITRMIQMTGTPAPNGLADVWSQMVLLDGGERLGRTITDFRTRFMVPTSIGDGRPAVWRDMQPGAEQRIYAAVADITLSRTAPPPTPGRRVLDLWVDLDSDTQRRYDAFVRNRVVDLVARHRGRDDSGRVVDVEAVTQVVANNAAVLANVLRQFASGTVYPRDDSDGLGGLGSPGRSSGSAMAVDHVVVHRFKMDAALAAVQRSLADGQPVIVATGFVCEQQWLADELAQRRITATVFDTARSTDVVRRWNAGDIPVLLIHPRSAGHGLNLQYGGSRLLWFTLPWGLEEWAQTNARLDRPGQDTPVTIVRLVARGTHDEHMPGVLAAKEQVQAHLLCAVDMDRPVRDGVLVDPQVAALVDHVMARLGPDVA